MTIKNSQSLEEKIKSVFETEGPVICEIMGKENQNYIHSSYVRNKQKKLLPALSKISLLF